MAAMVELPRVSRPHGDYLMFDPPFYPLGAAATLGGTVSLSDDAQSERHISRPTATARRASRKRGFEQQVPIGSRGRRNLQYNLELHNPPGRRIRRERETTGQ